MTCAIFPVSDGTFPRGSSGFFPDADPFGVPFLRWRILSILSEFAFWIS